MGKRAFKYPMKALLAALVIVIVVVILKWWREWYEYVAIRWSKRSYDKRLTQVARRKTQLVQSKVGPFDQLSTDRLKELVDVWHNGVADKFTSYGSLVNGVPPDTRQAKSAYEELVRRGESSIYLPYARLCEFGVPNDSAIIDEERALALYWKHFEGLTDLYQRYDALEAIERLTPPGMIFRVTALRSDIAGRMAALARANRTAVGGNNGATDLFQGGRVMAGPLGLRRRLGLHVPAGETWVQELPFDAFRAQNVGGAAQDVGDRQNVHDSTVTRTVAASVNRLRNQSGSSSDTGSSLSEIRNLIKRADVSPDKRDTANQALDSIERNNQLNSATGITETELLQLVWERLHHQDNAENQKALRENLVDELSACVENGGAVCSTGRFTHILGTLNGVDDAVDIRPGWALSKELVEKAGVMYRERIAALAEEDRVAVEAADPTEAQQVRNEEVMDTVRKDLRDDFKRSYVDAGIMTQEGLDVELNKWIDHIG